MKCTPACPDEEGYLLSSRLLPIKWFCFMHYSFQHSPLLNDWPGFISDHFCSHPFWSILESWCISAIITPSQVWANVLVHSKCQNLSLHHTGQETGVINKPLSFFLFGQGFIPEKPSLCLPSWGVYLHSSSHKHLASLQCLFKSFLLVLDYFF